MLPVLLTTAGLESVQAARVLMRRLVIEEVKSHQAFFFFCIRKHISAADFPVYPARKKASRAMFPSSLVFTFPKKRSDLFLLQARRSFAIWQRLKCWLYCLPENWGLQRDGRHVRRASWWTLRDCCQDCDQRQREIGGQSWKTLSVVGRGRQYKTSITLYDTRARTAQAAAAPEPLIPSAMVCVCHLCTCQLF